MLCLSFLSAHAAAPVVQEVVASPAPAGEAVTIYARATDADNDLHHYVFQYYGVDLNWTTIASVNVTGGNTWAKTDWVPYGSSGAFTVRVIAYDNPNNTATSSNTVFSLFQGTLVTNKVVSSGQIFDVVDIFDVRTKLDPRPSTFAVDIQSGGDSIFWSRQRVVLGPGFRAVSGSDFWAAVDSDMDGYSDAEEAIDTDGDGLFDAWEIDHAAQGFSPTTAGQGALDWDSDGTTNAAELQSGRNPLDSSDAPGMPSGYQLVLKTPVSPQFLKVNTTTWSILTAP